MKKKLLVILSALFLIPYSSFGQIDDYGLKLGALSAGTYSKNIGSSRVAGFGIYGFADIKLNPVLFSTLDLGYTRRGFTNSQNETDSMGQKIQTVEAISRLSYISFLGHLNVKFSMKSPFYIGAGPRVDYLVGYKKGEYDFRFGNVIDNTAEVLDDFILGGTFNTGIKNISIMSSKFRFELKYEVDFSDSINENDFTYRNNVVMLQIGVSL